MTIDARPARLSPGRKPLIRWIAPSKIRADLGREVEALQVVASEVDLAQPARVADQEVDPRMGGENLAREGPHRGGVGNVDRATFDAGKFGRELPELLRIAAAGDDGVAARPQGRDERLADSRRSAAHHGDRRKVVLAVVNHGFSVSCVGARRATAKHAKRRPRTGSRNEAAAKSDRSAVRPAIGLRPSPSSSAALSTATAPPEQGAFRPPRSVDFGRSPQCCPWFAGCPGGSSRPRP